MPSTREEINEVYRSEIDHKTHVVRQRQGIEAFLPRNMARGADGYQVFKLLGVEDIACSDKE